jgi:hypothetical protein
MLVPSAYRRDGAISIVARVPKEVTDATVDTDRRKHLSGVVEIDDS